ncbi:MAG: hypothetical protein WD342_16060 [Verrucomicrobiales bacterium]
MSKPRESSRGAETGGSRPKSTRYVLGASTLAALTLGLTFFLLVRGFQWRGALADLRAEPGIEILSVERSGFFKKRLFGLRDPLAPSADYFLRKHNIGPRAAELVLTEYHSLNTAYAREREANRNAEIAELRDSVVEAVADFAEAMTAKREEDLEKITRMLFEARFPEAMESVDLEWNDGRWLVKGELYAPSHEQFVEAAPDTVVDGELDLSHLVNLTDSRTSSLRKEIESADLFTVDLDGNPVHLDRVKRLVATYDEVCGHSDLPLPRVRLEATVPEPNLPVDRLDEVTSQLTAPGGIDKSRFLPAAIVGSSGTTDATASLKLVAPSSP